jgi:DNA-binding NarL/FixJ family response regulator
MIDKHTQTSGYINYVHVMLARFRLVQVLVVKTRTKRAISITDLGLDMSPVRVLVVEDFAPFWQFLRSTLAERPAVKVIGEAADGLEAVRKAELLEPDLVLLDIGLPTLNGIQAARQIRKLAPESKIIFVSQESSCEVVPEALNVGAWGYVVKTRAAIDLLAAVDTVLEGRHFVSVGLSIQNWN